MKNMEYFMVPAEKVSLQQFRKSEKEVIGGLCSLANIPLTPESARDQERRIRREIANSNERRRMQSINAGFQSLKTLIPHSDGEKLSKAAILQQTAEYIIALEQEKTQLLQQNNQLKRFIQQEFTGSSPKRRRTEEKDEGIGSPDILEEEKLEDLRRELLELRQHLEKERSARAQLEEQLRSLDTQLYPEKLAAVAQQVQDQHSLLHTQTLLRLQQLQQQPPPPTDRDSAPRSPQVIATPTPPAPTHHPTVIVPAPTHFATASVSPSPSSNIMSTSRQNLDTIVQAIQHIEGTQRVGGVEEEQRRAVIVTPHRVSMETTGSDTASDSEGEGNCPMT
ncbi:transcription factor AP-4-like isoform X1 [Sardina pilchardus]|uniref:transcription factor AP-4-like isoform X1 n=1 Tax=Sardina pilchardus TaxID=27697 RepID=UPI002E165DD5